MKIAIVFLCGSLVAGCASKPAEYPNDAVVVPPGSRTAVKEDHVETVPDTTPASEPASQRTTPPRDAAPADDARPPGTARTSDGRSAPVAPSPAADNTGTNKSDASGNTVTPMDQGNSKSDVDITAAIRRALMADASLSTTAKNVKIIAVKGKVTLRGAVLSADERDKIEAAAKRVAQSVDDQLVVKAK